MGFAMCRLTMLYAVKSHVNLVLQEILDEVVRELHKVKDEIINGKQQQKSSLQYPERANHVKSCTH